LPLSADRVHALVARIARLTGEPAVRLPPDWDAERDECIDLAAGQLLTRFRERDEHESFTLLVELTQPDCARIARTLVRQLGVNLDADDLVASFFARLFVDVRKGQPPVTRFLGLSRTAMRNEALNQLRHYKRAQARHEVFMRRRLAEPPVDPAAAAGVQEEEGQVRRLAFLLAAIVGHGFAALNARDREILTARELEDRSYEEIAGTLGLPRGQVGMILKRARERLERHIARMLQRGATAAERLALPDTPDSNRSAVAPYPPLTASRPRLPSRAARTRRGPGRGPESA